MIVLCGALLLCVSFLNAQPPKPDTAPASGVDKEGFITRWLLLAPIAHRTEKTAVSNLEMEHIKGEANLKPREGDKVVIDGKELVWKPYQNKEYFFDINDFLGSTVEDRAGYAVCYIVCDEEMKGLEGRAGTNDSGKIYLNGKSILSAEAARAIEKDQETMKDVTLNKGVNVIVFKVVNDTNNWAGCLRFMGKDGKPVQNFKVVLTPQ
jgi:hypothetical protein